MIAVSRRPANAGFQSTLPTRGSDAQVGIRNAARGNFNPRSPRGGATCAQRLSCPIGAISIHAPHEGERRPVCLRSIRHPTYFNPRSPRGGATGARGRTRPQGADFNPRSPRGGATAEKCICMQHFREFAEYYPLRHGDARCIAPQDCIIQAFFGAKKRCFYVRLCFALKNKGVRG